MFKLNARQAPRSRLIGMRQAAGAADASHDNLRKIRNGYSLERSQSMEPTKLKLPDEAIELYNLFIHGVISRRTFLNGVQ